METRVRQTMVDRKRLTRLLRYEEVEQTYQLITFPHLGGYGGLENRAAVSLLEGSRGMNYKINICWPQESSVLINGTNAK